MPRVANHPKSDDDDDGTASWASSRCSLFIRRAHATGDDSCPAPRSASVFVPSNESVDNSEDDATSCYGSQGQEHRTGRKIRGPPRRLGRVPDCDRGPERDCTSRSNRPSPTRPSRSRAKGHVGIHPRPVLEQKVATRPRHKTRPVRSSRGCHAGSMPYQPRPHDLSAKRQRLGQLPLRPEANVGWPITQAVREDPPSCHTLRHGPGAHPAAYCATRREVCC
ncbi:hypothetical protein SAMN05892883_0362 [Jatrophihabitans sp. GAS493]|nr:hypothetical protein SAMN05892883_0362 [Jatrophihabitans sp. GAS493]